MSAAAALLIELGWRPLLPDKWMTPSGEDYATMDRDDHHWHEVVAAIEQCLRTA